MEDQLISFETGLLAHEKGYTDSKDSWYYKDQRGCEWNIGFEEKTICKELAIKRPTQSLLQKWLREVHKIQIEIALFEDGYFPYFYKDTQEKVNQTIDYIGQVRDKVYSIHEEALEYGLQEALKLIKS